LQNIALEIRKTIIEMAHKSNGPHVGSALSCADIMAALYFGVLDIKSPESEERDRFILSKAHSAMALYSALFHKGWLDEHTLMSYYQNGGSLPAHTDRFTVKGIEISAGSLGHGLPIGLGIAHAFKLRGAKQKVYVLMGDGETQEGSVWEAAMLAPALKLSNLTVLIDYNNLQGYGRARELVSFEPLAEKWRAFGWNAVEVDGHDHKSIKSACLANSDMPKVIICNTTKGKGVSFMEDELKWHYFLVTKEHRENALKELNGGAK